ncbi:MAG: ATP synthase F1 subunit delta [Acidobacteriota bacterium]|nr:ATP synthase F1 subunit delta [Acidobacteriota bacterium]MDE3169205.1 ATP synthase F1 subunit delta [Acidobacteriota bacterium]
MSEAVASRYAAALADAALDEDNAERVRGDLAAFVAGFGESAELRNVLESPAVTPELKRKIVDELARRMNLASAVRNFVFLLIDHGRTEMLREIHQVFHETLNARLGIADAEVTSARELSAGERRELTAALEQRTGKKIEARFREDASLLGGAVVRVGSIVYDGSVREQLNRLRERLESE